MITTPTIMSLHLSYRLWIAELNADITVIRIFDDSIKELAALEGNTILQNGLAGFIEAFTHCRKEIDELRHEMHLVKMRLAASSKETTTLTADTSKPDDHDGLKKKYVTFRKRFDEIKTGYQEFESRALH